MTQGIKVFMEIIFPTYRPNNSTKRDDYTILYLNPRIDSLPTQITDYDLEVENAVGNLYREGYRYVTPAIIYREMYGYTDGRSVTKSAKEKIMQSMRKMQKTFITINTPEAEVNDVIISATFGEFKTSQMTRIIWKLLSPPLLFGHLVDRNHSYVKAPRKMLSAGGVFNTEIIMRQKKYLIRWIGMYMGQRKPILLDAFFRDTGDDAAIEKGKSARVIRARRVQDIKSFLTAWENEGFIRYYKVENNRIIITPRAKHESDRFPFFPQTE